MASMAQLMSRVRGAFPVPLDEALVKDTADEVVASAVQKALSKFEKIEMRTVTGKSIQLDDASAIVRCVPSPIDGSQYSVFDFMAIDRGRYPRVNWNFVGGTLIFDYEGVFHVEYVKDTAVLGVEDLDDSYFEWTVEYATALLMIKEGFLGTRATLTALPLEFNYNELRDRGLEAKERLEEKLEEMVFGCFGGLSN